MEKENTDGITTCEQIAACVGKGSGSTDGAKADGRYMARCFGPREESRMAYNSLFSTIQRLIADGVEETSSVITSMRETMAAMVEEKWADEFSNLITTQGKNDILDKYFQLAAPAGLYVGLISSVSYTTGPAIGDTAAQINGSNAWKEANTSTNYPQVSQGTRPVLNMATAASGGVKASSAASVFNIITNGGTVKGMFIATVNTFGGTTGTLLSAGTFSGGDKTVQPGDTLNVSYQVTLS